MTVSWRRSARIGRGDCVWDLGSELWRLGVVDWKLATGTGDGMVSGVAHWPQNRIPSGLSNPQCPHCMVLSRPCFFCLLTSALAPGNYLAKVYNRTLTPRAARKS